jgi:hypothetical protein
MRERTRQLIAATASILAGRVHTVEETHDLLYQLAIDMVSSERSPVPPSLRRRSLANEVLPRHQRASWARGKTVHDAEEG